MYLPLNVNIHDYEQEANISEDAFAYNINSENKVDVAKKIKILLQEAGVPLNDENLLLKGLLSGPSNVEIGNETNTKPNTVDLIQSENDFIDAYNALTRSTPLPNINDKNNYGQNENMIEIKNVLNKSSEILVQNNNITQSRVNAHEDLNTSNKNQSMAERVSGVLKNSNNNDVQPNIDNNLHISSYQVNPNNNVTQKSPHEEVNNKNSSKQHSNSFQQEVPQTENKPTVSKTDNLRGNPSTELDSHKPADEKSNNLSEMVDNTQRLIQQMKEEINSDINSIDGRTKSQSENDSSSEETNDEKESSYSDTEERSENITSDEKELTSSEDESSEEEKFNKQPSIHNRTSSEDNENFEEALDHVELQLEDFKNANIEMLNSIARTLQEEHTFTVEIDTPKVARVHKKQDLNNNLFTAVNSFEEIYEELNPKTANAIKVPQNVTNDIKRKTLDKLTKTTILHSVIKLPSPLKIVVTERQLQPVLKAKTENVKELKHLEEVNNIQPLQLSTVNNVKEELHNSSQNNDEGTDMNQEQQNIHYKSDTTDVMALHKISISDQPVIDNFDVIVEPIQSNNKLDVNDSGHSETSQEMNGETNVSNSEENEVVSNSNENVEESEALNDNKEKTPEISIGSPNGSYNNRTSILNKSNIPKLIKVVPSIRPKTDKNSPKLVVSKVPVRRTSIKQYPAPAPPKSHFGNVQSGHVKQLQTRLFNSKVSPSKPDPPKTIEAVATTSKTSTLYKKKPAPQPPTMPSDQIQVSSSSTSSPPKEKKQYFRETCRTEDEWTDSDSDNSQVQIIRPSEEVPLSPPSPPPPLTLRRVSGQLVDLAKVRLPEGSPERQARMLLAEGAAETWEQAQLAVELVSRGADPPAALLAALECTDLNSALAYLHQDCELCASRLPEYEMVSMLRCTHRCCRECAHLYFTVQITERSIADCVCPFCKLPELENLPEDSWLEYFAHLDILLKSLLEVDVHELFQRKLRDRTLARDPNFRWCMECSSGFFVHPKQKKIRCPECRSISCASCRKPWSANHEGLTCDQYTAWLEDNDPERSLTAIQQHLRDNGLECPRCHFKYSLSRGGCMHFTCTQCKYEFCYGCGKPFTMGARCGLSDYCAKLGLHSHHPRNCLFYLRDKEPHELQTLLQMNNVNYETEAAEGSTGRCPVQLQRETPTGLIDGICGSEAPANYAGLCKTHYVEYLAGLARGLDPIPIMDVTELVAELRRRAITLPERGPWDTDPIYAGMCAEIVKEKIPLD